MAVSAAMGHRWEDRRWCDCTEVAVAGSTASKSEVRYELQDRSLGTVDPGLHLGYAMAYRSGADVGPYLELGKPVEQHSIEVEAAPLSVLCLRREIPVANSGKTSVFDEGVSIACT